MMRQQLGLKSYHLEHIGNSWGKSIITLSEHNFETIIYYGEARTNESFPSLDQHVIIESEPNTYCYDAVWLIKEEIIIVDCARNGHQGSLENIFYFVNSTTS